MTDLTEAQREHLELCFSKFKDDLWRRIKLPAIGLAAVLAVFVSIFTIYLYMEAKIKVMDAEAEFASVKKEFYEDALEARKQIDEMMATYRVKLEDWNELAMSAEQSAKKMRAYESTLEQIATNFTAMTSGASPPVGEESVAPEEESIPPPLVEQQTQRSSDIFQLPVQRKTLR